ncbi:MAG: hypothetical protein N3A38_10775, partial [Planctomycetota bacterium]|nr:hypothetical protein [Planctomycetota bacterium]
PEGSGWRFAAALESPAGGEEEGMRERQVAMAGAGPAFAPALALLTVVLAAPGAAAMEEVEVSREGKAAIEMGLAYLARVQNADGTFRAEYGDLTGGVASACMAFMSVGNLPGEGKYGRHVARCVNFILNSAQPSGLLMKERAGQGVMYNHGLATLCLAEAWGHTQDPRIGQTLRRAVQLQIQSQADNGSWYYVPNGRPGDISITIMQLMALRAARDAGIAVPPETIKRAIGFVEYCKSKTIEEGMYGYCYNYGGQEPRFSNTAAAVLSLQVCGEYKPATVKPGLDFLVYARKNKKDSQWWMYGHYYAAQAMYQAGLHQQFKERWASWYRDVSAELIRRQIKEGREAGAFRVESPGGLIGTAWAIKVLAIPYRYLPIYQR